MPDMLMLGKVSAEEYPFDFKYRFWVGSDDEDGDFVSFDRGMGALSDAYVLWGLIDPEVRQRIETYIKTEIKQDWNELETGGYRVTVEQTKRLLEMIDDIDKKVGKFVDGKGKVLPEYYNFVSERRSQIVAEEGMGKELDNVYWLKAFMRKAVELNYELAFG